MKLADVRALRAKAVDPAPSKASTVVTDTAVLPFSVMEHLRDHPMLVDYKLEIRHVHECVARMLRGSWTPSDPPPPPPSYTPTGCFVCGGYIVIAERDGDYVCNECGVVQRARVQHAAFDAPVDIKARSNAPCALPKWLLKSGQNKTAYAREQLELVAHLNDLYTNLCEDDLTRAREYVKRSLEDERLAPDVRCAAALFAVLIRNKYDIDDMRARMQAKRPLDAVDLRPPVPQHRCPRCGARAFTPSDARRHPCHWGKRKRATASLPGPRVDGRHDAA